MKLKFNLKPILLLLGLLAGINSFSQNMETMLIENMEATSMIFPAECSPEHLIIVINSSLTELKFESNMLLSEEFLVLHNPGENQYIICHEKMKFKLTVSGPNLQSEDIDIFDYDKPLAFRISANTAKGTVNIITNPRNATVMFPGLNNMVLSTNQPITNVSGKYKVSIIKAQYKTVDTTIVIPRDAEKTYNIELIPMFSRIKIDLKTDDNNTVFQKAPVLWVDSTKIILEALVKSGLHRSFFDDAELYKLYEGNIIPVPEGMHKIKVEAEGFVTVEKTIEVKSGKLINLPVTLETIYGYLTFVDKQFAEGATVFVDNQRIGQVPLFKVKTKIGVHKIRYEKPGYIPLSEEYEVVVEDRKVTDVDVAMFVARKVSFETTPSFAEVFIDGNRIGFTPTSAIVNEGTHNLLIKKSGYATEKFTKTINDKSPDNEIQKIELRAIFPLTLKSEKQGLDVKIEGSGKNKNIVVDEKYKTPANISLPYGKYDVKLTSGRKTYYNGTINHKEGIQRRGKMPNYSKSSFRVLEGSIGTNQRNGKVFNSKDFNDINNFEAGIGRSQVFPGSGLSSAIINFEYDVISADTADFKALSPYLFFLNWDWRIGGSVLRQLDVNLLGRAKYTPGLKIIDINIPGLTDAQKQSYFYGFEVSTRLSYLNLNFRFGRQINMGKLNLWDEVGKKYFEEGIELLRTDQWVGALGITLNGKNYNSNYMWRLWQNPLVDPMKKKTRKERVENEGNFINKLKFWESSKESN